MPPRKWDLRIRDILTSIDKASEYIRGMDFEQFKADAKTVDAVVRNIEIIGEAASRVPENITAENPEIPWQDMRDMRNVLAHEYFGVNEKIIWNTIQEDLPPLIQQLKSLLAKHNMYPET